MYRTADSIWVLRYRFTPCCYRQELQQCRDLNTRMLSLPNPIDAFPLACMYADTADWATSTAESFIRETELIQARLLECRMANWFRLCRSAAQIRVHAAKQRVDEQQAGWGDWGATRITLG
jgi:hypothetical protein